MATKGRRPRRATGASDREGGGEGAPHPDGADGADAADEGEGSEAHLSEPDPAELDGEISPDLPELDGASEDSEDAGPDEAGTEGGSAALVPSGGRALARFDPLAQYIRDVRRYPLLSREEEHELAVKYV